MYIYVQSSVAVAAVSDTNHTEHRLLLLQHKCLMFATGIKKILSENKNKAERLCMREINETYNLARSDCVL